MKKSEELKKIYKTPEKSAFVKNFDNIAAMQFTGDLKVGGSTLSESGLEELRKLVQTVIEIYGEDWDFHIVMSGGTPSIQGIDILFPEVQISNSEGLSRNLKDLYVRLVLGVNSSGLHISYFQGARGKVSLEEYSCGYQHSHLHQTTYGRAPEGPMFDSFCTGSGEINVYRDRYNNSKSATDATKVLLQLYTLASWESIEGVPYFHMRQISYNGRSSRSVQLQGVSTTESSYNSFVNRMVSMTQEGKFPVKGIDVDITPDNKVAVTFSEEYILNMINHADLQSYVGVTFQGIIYTEASVVSYLQSTGNTTNPHNVQVEDIIQNTGYIYNGKEIALEISDFDPTAVEEKETTVELIKTIPDGYINKLKQRFEKDIYDQQVTRIISEQYA